MEYITYKENMLKELKRVNPEHYDELKEYFANYMDIYQKKMLEMLFKMPNFDENDNVYKVITNNSLNIINAPYEKQQSMLIPDEYILKLSNFSRTVFEKALNKLNEGTKITIEEKNKLEEELANIVKNIKPFNQEGVKLLISETTLDIEYAANDIEISSLRLGREIRRKKNK